MPTVRFFGASVRCRPMLDAMSAQEDLEHEGTLRAQASLRGPSAVKNHERAHHAKACRRNAAVSRLRDEERAAFDAWRRADTHERVAVCVVLTRLLPEHSSGAPEVGAVNQASTTSQALT